MSNIAPPPFFVTCATSFWEPLHLSKHFQVKCRCWLLRQDLNHWLFSYFAFNKTCVRLLIAWTFVSQVSRIPMNQLFHKNMSRPRSRLNFAPRQGQMAKQDGTKVLGRTTSQSDTSSLTFVCECTKLRMLLKSRLHQLLRWSNITHSVTVRDIVIGSVLTFNRCLNGGTSVTKWVLCVIDYKQTPLQTASKKQGAKTAHIRTIPP